MTRREWLAVAGVAVVAGAGCAASRESRMYGLIGKMKAKPGERDALAGILMDSSSAMPGCLSYIVAKDSTDADALWVTEVWESRERHQASLSLPAVKEAIAKGRPLIAGFGERFETEPVGGFGLPKS